MRPTSSSSSTNGRTLAADVVGGVVSSAGIVVELPERAVAAEAEQPADLAGLVVVVDVQRDLARLRPQIAHPPPCWTSSSS